MLTPPLGFKSFILKISVGLAILTGFTHAKPWKSAELGSTQSFKYGAFEGRIRAAQGSGMISTFFLWKYGSEVPGAQWQELDFEVWGKNGKVQTQAMTPGNPTLGTNRTEHTAIHTLPTRAWERYYTYRMEWTPKRIAFFIDGTLVREETDTVVYRKLLNPTLAEPMQLRTGIWAGNFDWSGVFDSTYVPQTCDVNWIQVFSYTPGQGPDGSDFTFLWRDDFNSIDWSRWTPSNWSFDAAISDYVTENHGIRNSVLAEALTAWQHTGIFPPAPIDDGLQLPLGPVAPRVDTVNVPGSMDASKYIRDLEKSTGNQGDTSCLSKDQNVDVKKNRDSVGGTCEITGTTAGEWLEYDFRLDSSRVVDFVLRAATGKYGTNLHLELDGTPVSSSLAVPAFGDTAFSEVKFPSVPVSPGIHSLRVVFENGSVNLSSIRVRTAGPDAPIQLPGQLNATNYTRYLDLTSVNSGYTGKVDEVDKGIAEDPYTNMYIGWTRAGEWLEYDVFAPTSAFYDLTLRLASPYSASGVRILVDDTDVSGLVKSTAKGWLAFADAQIPAIALNAGNHVVRISMETGNTNLRYLQLAASTTSKPLPVTGLTATPGDASVQLSWQASIGARVYKVVRDLDTIAVISGTSHLDLSPSNGTEYTYSVVAANENGNASASIPVNATPSAPPAPRSPTGLTAIPKNGQVDLSWDTVFVATSYRVYRSLDGITYSAVATTSEPRYLDFDVINGTSYNYEVSALNGSSESVPSTSILVTPLGDAPAQVSDLVATPGDAIIQLTWNPVPDATGYTILRKMEDDPESILTVVSNPGYLDQAVANGTHYSYTVIASNQWGAAKASAAVSAIPQAIPAPPTNLTATAGDATTTLAWVAGANNVSFNVYRSATGGVQTRIATTTTTSYLDQSVANGTTYSYSVTGTNNGLESPASPSVTATPRGLPPASVADLTATAGNGSVALSWPPTAGATTYLVLRSAGGSLATQVGSSSTSSFTDATVVNGTTYSYSIVATNTWGEALPSASVDATPKGVAPAQATGLVATAGNASVSLVWKASIGATSYGILRSNAGNPSMQIGTSTTPSFVDVSANNGTTYTYSVIASNVWGNADASAPSTATPLEPAAKLKAQYKAGSVGSSINGIRPLLQIVNTGTTSVSLSQVTVRYWYTKDGVSTQNYWCDWAQIGQANISAAFKAVSPTRTNADTYLELSFKSAAGNLAPGASTGEIQSRFSKNDWSSYNQTNDASYDGTKSTSYADWSKVTVYVNGTLVWGVEP